MKKMEGDGVLLGEIVMKVFFYCELFISVLLFMNEIEDVGEWLVLFGGWVGCNFFKVIIDLGGFMNVWCFFLEECFDKDFLVDLFIEWFKVVINFKGVVVCWFFDVRELEVGVFSEEL